MFWRSCKRSIYRGRTFDENVWQGTAALNGRKPRVETPASDQRRRAAELCGGRLAHASWRSHSQQGMSLRSEHVKVCFRADALNVFNRAQYVAPNAKLSQVNFGEITTTISNYAKGRG